MNVDSLIEELIHREGGYTNHPADRGGPTRWGVTETVARAHGYDGDMRNLSRDLAAEIYRRKYWIAPHFDRIAPHAPKVAAELFDTGANMGPTIATGFLRRALNALNRGASDYPDIPAAGTIDDGLVAALATFLAKRGDTGETVLLKAIEALQGERYLDLAERRPANEAFLYGWLANRLG
jgi:lysozyme family protein